jgi:ferritin-like metal-binding protein YciE
VKRSTKEELLIYELQALHYAEDEVKKVFPRLAEAASSRELKAALSEHLDMSRQFAAQFQEFLEKLGSFRASACECVGIRVLLDEVEKVTRAGLDPEAVDVELALGAQRIKQYQIPGYQAVQAYAASLGHNREARYIERIVSKEQVASKHLSDLSERLFH